MSSADRRAFSLVELLVVMSVITILAATLLVAGNILKRNAVRSRSQAIIATVRMALATGDAKHGGSIASVEHPLAGSAPPRTRFVRAADGTAVAMSGQALVVDDMAWLRPASWPQVLLADDRYVGSVSPVGSGQPLLYGMPRWQLRILGAASAAITSYRRMPSPVGTRYDDGAGYLREPIDDTIYPRRDFVVEPSLPAGSTLDSATTTALDYALESVRDELIALGGIHRSPAGAEPIVDDKLRSDGAGDGAWQRGTVWDGTAWRPYRLPGSALYDAWGSELLIAQAGNGAVLIESAGADGVFRWHPGEDGVYQTAAEATVAAGDDRDGSKDNLVSSIHD